MTKLSWRPTSTGQCRVQKLPLVQVQSSSAQSSQPRVGWGAAGGNPTLHHAGPLTYELRRTLNSTLLWVKGTRRIFLNMNKLLIAWCLRYSLDRFKKRTSVENRELSVSSLTSLVSCVSHLSPHWSGRYNCSACLFSRWWAETPKQTVNSYWQTCKSEVTRSHIKRFLAFSSLCRWCCYITVDFATAASQNGFRTYKLSFHNKTNIIQKMTNNIFI
jgi:hypothetical protein